ncbi:MAG: hypothetical protein DWQ01_15190 [Planctomycetota bacterium]|nr:MAG: hypothetical protein DWQ01_15190 [Planctomycetota bacterium]
MIPESHRLLQPWIAALGPLPYLAAVAGIAFVAWWLSRRLQGGSDPNPIAEESAEPQPAPNRPPATVWQRLAWEAERRGFQDLQEFGLVEDFSSYFQRVFAADHPDDSIRANAKALDPILTLALAEAILKLEQEEVPREIAGQRLAEVYSFCQEADAWEDLPKTTAVARRFLSREPDLAEQLAIEIGRS